MTEGNQNEIASKRIALTPSEYDKLRDFASGMKMNYHDALNALLDDAIPSGKDAFAAGREFARKIKAKKREGVAPSTKLVVKSLTAIAQQDDDTVDDSTRYVPIQE